MSTAQHKTLSDFIKLKNRHALTHAVRAATELGVFRALSAGQRTVEQLANELDADSARLAALMQVLTQTELVEQYQEDFALSTLARLIPDAFYDLGDSYWRHLVGHIKTGDSIHTMEHSKLGDDDFVINQAAEEWTLTPAGMTAAEALDIGNSRRGLKIIELGCGSAVVGASLAHADETSHLTLVDRPQEIRRATETVNAIDVGPRTVLVSADDWRNIEVVDLSGHNLDSENEAEQTLVPQPTFDLVLLTRLIHMQPIEKLEPLVKKIGDLLLPSGGELAIVDVFPGQDESKSFYPALELEFGLRHSHGRYHHPKELEPVLKSAGFPDVQFAHLPAEPHFYGLMLAGK